MATGVPARLRALAKATPASCAPAELAYDGKRSREEILAEPAHQFPILWDGEGENRLYCADNLLVLRSLLREPSVAGQVRLVYIDPPFATRSRFQSRGLEHAYDDVHSGAAYLEQLRERLVLLRELLAEDGSIYVHLDEKMVFHVKLVMDEVFGAENYRNCIVRRKCNPKNYTRRAYGNVADFVLFYTRSDDFVFNRPVEPWTEERAREYRYVEPDTGRRFMKVPVHAPGTRNGATGQPWRGKLPPPGKHWQYPPGTLDELDARGEIVWSANGNPRRKVYLDETAGVAVQDIWTDLRDAHNQNVSITGYPTEKNPDLLRRIVEASSNAGDLVLDCYAGSGTTLAAAAALSRRWIGVDDSVESLRTVLRRLEKGTEPMGDFVGARRKRRAASPHPPTRDFRILAGLARDPAIDDAIGAWLRQR
ncbi:MAG TPA: site-specific DNA-methyltransferase [Anaeromyxobacteraceae bacterium]|nr:site-specific DNA-methyltransferase [Anaeromyxobacteraceae bacterium]